MLFKALFILLCFVVMFGCLDAGPNFWPGKKRSSERPASRTTNAKPAEGKRTTKKKQSTEKEVETCTICLAPLSTSLKQLTNCEHTFHEGCIKGWLQYNENNSCPLCRAEVTNTELRKLGGRTAPTNENGQQTTQHPPHIITDETQTFTQNPWHIAPSRENEGGWESHEYLLNGNDQRNNGHDQTYYGGPGHFWDQAQNQRQSNVWEEQYPQEQNYGQQNQRMFNDNYNAGDFALDIVGAIGSGIRQVAGSLFGTQDSEHMGTSQSGYDNPIYHDHHMGTSQYGNPLYHAGPSQTISGQPAPGQVVHAPNCPHHHQPNCPHHQPPHFYHHHPTK